MAGPKTTTSDTYYAIRQGSYRYYLIWITKLGPGYDQARINEVASS